MAIAQPHPLPASQVLYHYTTRAIAQEISMAGRITAGRSGLVYLTDVLFRLGWQATDYLALPEKVAEIAIPVPVRILTKEVPAYYGQVQEWTDATGRSMRRGGGHQWAVGGPIPLEVFPWSWIELEAP